MAAGGSQWLTSLTPAQRTRVHKIIRPKGGIKNDRAEWWIWYKPTTGEPKDVVLSLKTWHRKTIREYRIWPPEEDE